MSQRMWRRGPHGEIVRVPPAPALPETSSPEAAAGARRRPRASFALALRLGLRDTYDHMGAVLVLSVGWSVVACLVLAGAQSLAARLAGALPGALPLLAAGAAVIVGCSLAGGPALAGLFRFCLNGATRQEPEILDVAWGFRNALGRSIRLALAQSGVAAVLAANAAFYLYLAGSIPGVIVAGLLFLYALLFWSCALLYQWPLLVEEEIPVRALVKKSLLLVLDNPGFTLLLALTLAALTLLLWATAVGGVLVWAGAAAFLQTQATRELLRRYGLLPPDPTLDPIAEETLD